MPEPTVAWSEGWLWLSGSLLMAVLWANLAWFFRQPRPGALGEFVARLVAWRFSPWLLQILRLLYYIGVPYAALVWRRAVIKRYLGLSSSSNVFTPVANIWVDWAYDVGWAVALGIGAWILLTLSWRAYRRALVTAGKRDVVAGSDSSGWVLLREAVYHEIHWAFYRNAPIFAWDTYWGTWAGLALVALEAVLNPAWRKGLADPQEAPALLMRGALAVVSSVLFWRTENGNLWLALALHWGVSWSLAALVRAFPLPAHKSEQAPA